MRERERERERESERGNTQPVTLRDNTINLEDNFHLINKKIHTVLGSTVIVLCVTETLNQPTTIITTYSGNT